MTKLSPSLAALLGLALAACQQHVAIDNEAEAVEMADADVETLAPDATPSSIGTNEVAVDRPAPVRTAPVIPAQYNGRWGMVVADCTSTRGDAKGLMTIADTTIRFYEATATLVEQRPAIATGFAGFYRFAGEGQTWEKIVTLKRSGDTLTRSDKDGNFSYRQC